MDPRIAPLTVLTEAVASCQPHLFELSVEAACATGASQQDLITAVEVARLLGEVPPRVLARAYASIDAVREIEASPLTRSADESPFAPSQGKGDTRGLARVPRTPIGRAGGSPRRAW